MQWFSVVLKWKSNFLTFLPEVYAKNFIKIEKDANLESTQNIILRSWTNVDYALDSGEASTHETTTVLSGIHVGLFEFPIYHKGASGLGVSLGAIRLDNDVLSSILLAWNRAQILGPPPEVLVAENMLEMIKSENRTMCYT